MVPQSSLVSMSTIAAQRTLKSLLHLRPVPLLEISIDGCRIWLLAEKIKQKSLNKVSGLDISIDGVQDLAVSIKNHTKKSE